MKTLKLTVTTLIFTCSSIFSSVPVFAAQSKKEAKKDRSELKIDLPVTKFVLSNGLTVLLLEDHTVPLVSYHTWYRVGSRHEYPGVTGAAHMLEHMMFKGAKKYDGKQFDHILHANGMENNAFTTYDYTGFYQILPSDRLELMMDLEVDRMSSLNINPKDLLSEKEVVKEERRWRTENNPSGVIRETLLNNLFKGSSYEWPVIGYMEDIDAYTSEKLRFFYEKYYKPNNAVLVIAGDIDPVKTKSLVEKYYGSLKAASVSESEFKERTPIESSREIEVKKDVQTATLMMAWPSVPAGHPDSYALDLAGSILGGGSSSRLYKKMIYQDQTSTSAFAYNYSMKKDGLFSLGAMMKPGADVKKVKASLLQQLEAMKSGKIADAELERAKTGSIKGTVDELTTLDGKARALAVNEIVMGDYKNIYDDAVRYESVTTADIQRVLKKYLDPKKSLIVKMIPEKSK